MIDAAQIELARSVPIEDECARRGHPFWLGPRHSNQGGPCLVCGGVDRFSVNTKKQVWFCRQCSVGGDVIDLVQFLDSCTFAEAVETLLCLGPTMPRPVKPSDGGGNNRAENGFNQDAARKIWHAGVNPLGTPVETYLRRDGLGIPEWAAFNTIRYGMCSFGDEVTSDGIIEPMMYPTMICLVSGITTNAGQGVHRTALTPNGSAVKRNGKTLRMSLGPISGGAIMLDRPSSVGPVLAIGEGVETCLAGRHYGYLPCWSVISKTGIKSFPLIPGVEQLTIFVDNDEAGEEAAEECKARWIDAGRHVRLIRASAGKDLRDELRASLAELAPEGSTKEAGSFGDREWFMAEAQKLWPGATILTEAEKAERAQFRKELAGLKAENDRVYRRIGRRAA